MAGFTCALTPSRNILHVPTAGKSAQNEKTDCSTGLFKPRGFLRHIEPHSQLATKYKRINSNLIHGEKQRSMQICCNPDQWINVEAPNAVELKQESIDSTAHDQTLLQSDLNTPFIEIVKTLSQAELKALEAIQKEAPPEAEYSFPEVIPKLFENPGKDDGLEPLLKEPEAVVKVDPVYDAPPRELNMTDMMKLILGFAGPALVIWVSSPLMSLIDTAVVGRSSSLELAALGPGTVVCDNIFFLFSFLSVATSNLVATAVAHQDFEEASGHFSRLLSVALTIGCVMVAFTYKCVPTILTKFVGSNTAVIPAATTYANIRGLSWPAVLVMLVAQSASLGMQDAWGPLYALGAASIVNLVGDIVLCSYWGMGIAGAAWATMASQYVGCFLMLYVIQRAKKIRLSLSLPSAKDLRQLVLIVAPLLLTMVCKTSFYTMLSKVATSLGTASTAAHQVLINLFALCAVCGEPLSQTAQSYIPGFREGKHRNISQARLLLKSLLVIGVAIGSLVGLLTASVPWILPNLFTSDALIVAEMQKVTVPLFLSLMLTPIVLSLEGTLMGGKDTQYMATVMAVSFVGCLGFLVVGQNFGLGLLGNWWTLVAFQFIRMIQEAYRLISSKSILREQSLPSLATESKPHFA